MKYLIFFAILICISCSSSENYLLGSWKLHQVFNRSTASNHSMTTHLQNDSIRRTLTFTDTECTDVLYRDGKLEDSMKANYRIAGKGQHLSVFHNQQMTDFWEILSVGKDTMKLLTPSNLVYVFIKLEDY